MSDSFRKTPLKKVSRALNSGISPTQILINKLNTEKKSLEFELSARQKSSQQKPTTFVQTSQVRRGSDIHSHQKAAELQRLLRLQDQLQDKIDAFDRQDDPVVQQIEANHFSKNPVYVFSDLVDNGISFSHKCAQGLLAHVKESAQNVLGSLATVSSATANADALQLPSAKITAKASSTKASSAVMLNRPDNQVVQEEKEMKRLSRLISRAIRAISSQPHDVQPHNVQRPRAVVAAPPARPLSQALSGSKAAAAEVNPELQLQGLKKLARDWIGYKGGISASPAPVLCPPLSPRRFRSFTFLSSAVCARAVIHTVLEHYSLCPGTALAAAVRR